MDKLIGELNKKISDKIGKSGTDNAVQPGTTSKFSDMLTEKLSAPKIDSTDLTAQNTTASGKSPSEQMFIKLSEDMQSEEKNELKVFSGDGIQIKSAPGELVQSSNFDPKERFMGIFEDLNSDMLSLDSAIEVLADPSTKLTKRQLLAYQAGIGNMTINADLFSRLAQSVSQNLNTLLNTQI